jgi:hypothetical protein
MHVPTSKLIILSQLENANVGTGMTFKNHLLILIPSLHHLELKAKEKENFFDDNQKNTD